MCKRRFLVVSSCCTLLLACSNAPRHVDTHKALPACEPGGRFLVGVPELVDGSCEGYLPPGRDVVLTPVSPGNFEVGYAGAVLEGSADDTCTIRTATREQRIGGYPTSLSLAAQVLSERIDVEVTLRRSGLPDDAVCDVVYKLVGQRAPASSVGPTGSACGGFSCNQPVCAFGGDSACGFDVCLVQQAEEGSRSYCTEPCVPGSCPLGYSCEDVLEFAFGTAGTHFCVQKQAVCGDGVREGSEACDDGNQGGGDGCSADCRSDETCGNGVRDSSIGELCDDGNNVSGDGCSSLCVPEVCGNHILDPGEICDDGNSVGGDGCSEHCTLEACGNGIVDVGEACDDGNAFATDGCDPQCRIRLQKGVARADGGWQWREGGAQAKIEHYAAAPRADTLVYAWSESYAEASPFGASPETYVAIANPQEGWVSAPSRVLASGYSLTGLVSFDSGELLMLLQADTGLASSLSHAGAPFAVPQPLTIPSLPSGRVAFARLFADAPTSKVLYLLVGVELDSVSSGNRNLFFSRSLDGGSSWAPAVHLSAATDGATWAREPVLLASGLGDLAIAWGDGQFGAGSVYVARSLDRGANWLRKNEEVGAHRVGSGNSSEVDLLLQGGAVQLAFFGPDGLRVGRWQRNATAWSFTTVAPAGSLGSDVDGVRLARGAADAVYVTLRAGRWPFVATSTDGGRSFTALRPWGRPAPGVAYKKVGAPALAVAPSESDPSLDKLALVFLADAAVGSGSAWAVYGSGATQASSGFGTALQLAPSSSSGSGGAWTLVSQGGKTLALYAYGGALWLFDLLALELPAPAPSLGKDGSGCEQAKKDGGWCTPSSVAAPSARYAARAVAAGSTVVLFGGHDDFAPLGDGGRYASDVDAWLPMADATLPPVSMMGRSGHSVVWTGSEVLIFGGHNDLAPLGDGAAYDPAANTWRPLSQQGAPSPRTGHSAVWADGVMIVYGGRGPEGPLSDGGIYDPVQDSWQPLSPTGYPGTYEHSAVWTGAEMITFGGFTASGQPTTMGLRYSPLDDTVLPLPSTGAPAARGAHLATFVPTSPGHMLVWGGRTATGAAAGGGVYRLLDDSWDPLPQEGAPGGSLGAALSAIDTGLFVWGGASLASSGAIYDDSLTTWTSVSPYGAPLPRSDMAVSWISAERCVLLQGGRSLQGAPLAGGALYCF